MDNLISFLDQPEPGGCTSSQMQKGATGLFRKAVEQRASDIHIRVSKRGRTLIFFRVHNDMEFVYENTFEFGEQLCSTIYQAMADVSDATFETNSRQDARISDKAKLPEKIDGIRIATLPQVDGFIMVLRLLYNDAADSTDHRQLGFNTVEDPPEYPISDPSWKWRSDVSVDLHAHEVIMGKTADGMSEQYREGVPK